MTCVLDPRIVMSQDVLNHYCWYHGVRPLSKVKRLEQFAGKGKRY